MVSIVLIACLGALVYSNTFLSSFHFDDKIYIIDNFFIRDIHNLFNIWQCCPCRFLTFLSLALNYHYHQLNVLGYHLFNLAIHLACAILVWWLVLLTLSTPAFEESPTKSKQLGLLKGNKISKHADLLALFAGLVFVSHPIQTQAVTYIWQRAASMATLFYLASLCLYVKSKLPCRSPGLTRLYYTGSLMTAVAAMFTKEIAVTLPLMILLYEFSFFETKKTLNWRRLSPFLLTLFIIPLTMLLTKSARFQEIQNVVQGPHGITPAHYLFTQFRVIITYLRLCFLPLNQNIDHDYPVFKSIFELPVLLSILFLAMALFAAKRLFSKYRLVSFSILWFLLTLLPESSILPQKDVLVEHRLYLPLVGYSVFLVSGIYYLCQSRGLTVVMIIIACYSVMTYQRNEVWKNELTLWTDAIKKSPHKARAYGNRGNAYFNQGDLARAMSDFNKTLEINPGDELAYNNRGKTYQAQGRFAQAMPDYNKAIELNPVYEEAYANRGLAYGQQGDFKKAIIDLSKAIDINPFDVDAYNNRGVAYYKQGHFAQAMSDYDKAIEINPGYLAAYRNRAKL